MRKQQPISRSTSGGTGGGIKGSVFLKLLVPDRLAGVIIGRAGSGIGELEQETGASMRLSGSRIYFPGTSERVMVAGGETPSIEKLIALLVSKLNEPAESSPQVTFRMILTNSACSCIIGKGGDVIKSISAQTGCTIRASDRVETASSERIVDIRSQNIANVVAAAREITHRIQEDVSFKELAPILNYFQPAPAAGGEGQGGPAAATASSYYYPNTSTLAAAAGAAGAHSAGSIGNMRGGLLLVDQFPISIKFAVPANSVGAVIGKNGEARNRIVHSTGANVVVSERTEDHAAERDITISGPLAAVQAALTLVAKLIVDSSQ